MNKNDAPQQRGFRALLRTIGRLHLPWVWIAIALALNLALILLLCAVFPASAAGTAAQPAADAQPQQTAQPTEDSTQPQTTAPNPGTHTLTINGETRTIGTERQSGVGWTSVATMNGDGER